MCELIKTCIAIKGDKMWTMVKNLVAVTILSILATLVNPYGFSIYQSVTAIPSNPFNQQFNMEWLPLFSRGGIHVLVGALVIACYGLFFIKKNRLNLTELLLSLLFFFFSLKSVRMSLFFFTLFLPLVATFIRQTLLIRFRLSLFSPPTVALAAFSLAILSRGVYNVDTSLRMMNNPAFLASYRQNYPYGAINYIKTHPVPERLINYFNWGGYLVWQLPERKVFENGIMDVFKVVGDRFFLDDYHQIVYLGPHWQELFDQYQVEGILLPPNLPLVQMIRVLPNWEILYEDKVSVLAVKQNIMADFCYNYSCYGSYLGLQYQ